MADKTKYNYEIKKIGAIVISFSGGTPSKNDHSFWEGNVPWVSPKDFGDFYISDSEDHISEDAIGFTKKVPEYAVLVVVRSGILKHTLPIAVNTVSVTINQDVKALIPMANVDASYLAYFLKVFETKILGRCVKHSTTVQSVNSHEFFSLEVPIPPLDTQKKLSAYMDMARREYERSIKEAENILKNIPEYILKEMGLSFSRSKPQTFYAIPSSILEGRLDADFYSPKFLKLRKAIQDSRYKAVCIGDVCESIISGFAAGKQDQADDLPDNERVPQLRPFSITPYGQISFTTKKYVPISRLQEKDYCQKGEVLFNNTNSAEWVGKSTVFDIDTPCAASNHITRITLKEGINPYYIAAFFNMLRSIGYWKLLSTYFNNQAGVNIETLKAVRILLPEKPIQDEIAEEILKRKNTAEALRIEAEQDWEAAKAEFERELLGEMSV